MKLDDWLKAQKTTSVEFARTSGIGNKQAVHKYRHGERFPTPENLRRIREATNGAVTAEDFVDQHAGTSPPFRVTEAKPSRSRAKRPASRPPTPASPSPVPDEAAE